MVTKSACAHFNVQNLVYINSINDNVYWQWLKHSTVVPVHTMKAYGCGKCIATCPTKF